MATNKSQASDNEQREAGWQGYWGDGERDIKPTDVVEVTAWRADTATAVINRSEHQASCASRHEEVLQRIVSRAAVTNEEDLRQFRDQRVERLAESIIGEIERGRRWFDGNTIR